MANQLTPNFDNGLPNGVARVLALAEKNLAWLSGRIKASENDRDQLKADADEAALAHEAMLSEALAIQTWINCTKADYKVGQ